MKLPLQALSHHQIARRLKKDQPGRGKGKLQHNAKLQHNSSYRFSMRKQRPRERLNTDIPHHK